MLRSFRSPSGKMIDLCSWRERWSEEQTLGGAAHRIREEELMEVDLIESEQEPEPPVAIINVEIQGFDAGDNPRVTSPAGTADECYGLLPQIYGREAQVTCVKQPRTSSQVRGSDTERGCGIAHSNYATLGR